MALKINNPNKRRKTVDEKDTIKLAKSLNRAGKKISKAIKKKALPKKGFKTVAKSVKGENKYKLSNEDILAKYFNKNGSLKKSALRSNKQRQQFESELKKAKEEIKQQREIIKKQQEELKQLRAQLKKDREEKRAEELKRKLKEKKDKAKRQKQLKTYKETGHSYSTETYQTFVDILDDVYDEVSLIFYDSDQVMQWIDEDMTVDDIKKLLTAINKNKEKQLTNAEKELLKSGQYHMDTVEKERMTEDVAEVIWLANRQNELSPEEIWNMRQTDYNKYVKWQNKYK